MPSGSRPGTSSPLADGGYDVADYRAIDPGLRDARRGRGAHRGRARAGHPDHRGRRPQPRLGPASLVPGRRSRRVPGSPGACPVLVPSRRGRGRRRDAHRLAQQLLGHDLDPHHRPDGTPGEWYLHLFSAEQPDLNWDHPDVRREHEDILRFWFDRGAAGVRIDSAALLVKDADAARGALPIAVARGSIPTPIATSCTTSTAAGAPSRTRIPARASWWARCGCPDVARFALLPAAGRAPHGVQLRLHGPAVGRRRAAGVHRPDPRGACAHRRAGHLGPVQPRRDPAGDALRARGQLVRVPRQAPGRPQRPGPRASGAPARRRCSSPRCRAPCTSTRATSWAWTR